MRPRVKPALRRIMRDEQTLQYGVHPLRAITLSSLTPPVRRWLESLDGTRDLERVLHEAAAAGLDESRARSLLDQLTAQGALHDAAISPGPLRDLSLAEQDRLRPDLDALDLDSIAPEGGLSILGRRREMRVRVYGAGRVGAQIVALLAAAGIGNIRVFDTGPVRPRDITPGGLTWAEIGLSREEGAVAVARRLTSGSHTTMGPAPRNTAGSAPRTTTEPAPRNTAGSAPRMTTGSASRGAAAHASRNAVGHTSHGTARPASHGVGGVLSRGEVASRNGGTTKSTPRRATPALPGTAAASPQGRPVPCPEDVSSGSPDPHVHELEVIAPAVNALAGGPYLGDKWDRPDLVILAPVTPLDGVLVNELISLSIPHMLASAFEGHGIVGPLVLPRQSACLHCLDLTRRDNDPAWPIVTARVGGYPPGEIACGSALATVVAAEATGHTLAFLDGKPSAVTNSTMDISPDWRWKRQAWRVHPQCRCMRNNPYSLRMVMAPDRD
ncbi:ThiF family adenylyltransferase [Nonomuraea sp. NPDC046802]|uniref:ThiF family adenylyltransferase n=1 Tax=Nonomuraea sp. NPDC046802 TaxID=3154919 RepID=UPI0033F0EA5D